MRRSWVLAALFAAAAAGCGQLSAPTPRDQAPSATPPSADSGQAGEPADQEETGAATRQVAQVGVGQKGRSLDDETGVGRIIAQPAIAYFAVRERMVFEVQIPQAMQLFKAVNGQAPQSHEEFMQKIVAANRIQLPELRPEHKYVYDPETEQLMVEGPAR